MGAIQLQRVSSLQYSHGSALLSLLEWWTFHLLLGTGGTTRGMHYPNEGTPTVATTVEADNLVRYGWSTACLLGWSVLEPKAEYV